MEWFIRVSIFQTRILTLTRSCTVVLKLKGKVLNFKKSDFKLLRLYSPILCAQQKPPPIQPAYWSVDFLKW